MAYNIPGVVVTAVKMASGNVRMDFLDARGPGGGTLGQLRFSVVIPAADFTSFNTTVNGGATNATLTKAYAQDAFPVDYPDGYILSV